MANLYRAGHFFEGHLLEPVTGEKWTLGSGFGFKKKKNGHCIQSLSSAVIYGATIPFDWENLLDKWVCFSYYGQWIKRPYSSSDYVFTSNTNDIQLYFRGSALRFRMTIGSYNINELGGDGYHVNILPFMDTHLCFFLKVDTVTKKPKFIYYMNGVLYYSLTMTIDFDNASTIISNLSKTLSIRGFNGAPFDGTYFLRTFTDVQESEIPNLAASEWQFAQGIRTNQKPVYKMFTPAQFAALPSGTNIIDEDFSNYSASMTGSLAGDKGVLTGKEKIPSNFNLTREQRLVGRGNLAAAYPLGVDSNLDGLSDGWAKGTNTTASIVTGNGFTGNAQRIDGLINNGLALSYSSLTPPLQSNDYGSTFIVKGKYRSNVALNATGYYGTLGVILPINTEDAIPFEYHAIFNAVVGFSLRATGWMEVSEFEYIKLIDIHKIYYQRSISIPIIKIPSPSGIFEMESQGDVVLYFNINRTTYQYLFRIRAIDITLAVTERTYTLLKNTSTTIATVTQPIGLFTTITKTRILNNRSTGEVKVWVDGELIFDIIDTTYNNATHLGWSTGSGKILAYRYYKL